MNKGRGIGLGIFLLTIGVISILLNFGFINWSIFDALLVLWPLILVVAGINIIFRKHWIVRLVTWFAFIAVLIVYGNYLGDTGQNINDMKAAKDVYIEMPYGLKESSLKLSLGACSLKLDSGTANLLDASIKDENIKYSSNVNSDENSASILFSRKSTADLHLGNYPANTFKLNEAVTWNINVDTGASNCDLDLTKLKVDSFEYDGGASKLTVAFGDRNSLTKVKIDTGVSKVDLLVPETAGVRVRTDKGLSNTDFDGSGWIRKNGCYETDNYENASCRIDIDADIGLSDLNVRRAK